MSTAPLIRAGGPSRERASNAIRIEFVQRFSPPLILGAGLLLLVLYAAFAHAGVSQADGTRIEVAIAAIAALAGGAWLWTGSLRLAASPGVIAGAAVLAGFAAWSAVTVFWSVAPDETWIELNRTVAYVVVLVLAIAVGASHARSLELVGAGFIAAALLVTAYALGQKLLPGFHIPGVFNLNQTGPLPRLQEPLGYWNALALFVVLAVPMALAVAADPTRGRRLRLAALCSVVPFVLTIAFTFSRGGLLALVVALVVAAAASHRRLQWLMWLGVAGLGSALPLAAGLSTSALTSAGSSLSSRERAGAELIVVLAVSLLGMLAGARRLLDREPQLTLDQARAAKLRRLGLGLLGVALVGVVIAMSVSGRGFTGTISHAWNSFTATRATSNYDPGRLLSADSQNRWVWWKEAAGAFNDRPVGGWGAGSFGVVHLLYRRNTLTVQEPHSVPLQFLAETGIVGALLALIAFALLLRGAVDAVRRLGDGRERLLAGALLAGVVAYAVHTLYDWDWDIPAVTLPVLLFAGVLAGARARVAGGALPRRRLAASVGPTRPRLSSRAVGLAALTLWLCAFALSAELPELAASNASAALVQASATSPGALSSAHSKAALAAELDPLSDAGPRAEATIALHQGRPLRARADLEEAVAREPSDSQAWNQLAYLEVLLADRAGAALATQRLVALDPRSRLSQTLERTYLLAAPPRQSVTAAPTALPSG